MIAGFAPSAYSGNQSQVPAGFAPTAGQGTSDDDSSLNIVDRPDPTASWYIQALSKDPTWAQQFKDRYVTLNNGSVMPLSDYTDRMVKASTLGNRSPEAMRAQADMAGVGVPTFGDDDSQFQYAGRDQAYDFISNGPQQHMLWGDAIANIMKQNYGQAGQEWADKNLNGLTWDTSPNVRGVVKMGNDLDTLGTGFNDLVQGAASAVHYPITRLADDYEKILAQSQVNDNNADADPTEPQWMRVAHGLASVFRQDAMTQVSPFSQLYESKDPGLMRLNKFVNGAGDLATYFIPYVGPVKVGVDLTGAANRIAMATPQEGFLGAVGEEAGNFLKSLNPFDPDPSLMPEDRLLRIANAAFVAHGGFETGKAGLALARDAGDFLHTIQASGGIPEIANLYKEGMDFSKLDFNSEATSQAMGREYRPALGPDHVAPNLDGDLTGSPFKATPVKTTSAPADLEARENEIVTSRGKEAQSLLDQQLEQVRVEQPELQTQAQTAPAATETPEGKTTEPEAEIKATEHEAAPAEETSKQTDPTAEAVSIFEQRALEAKTQLAAQGLEPTGNWAKLLDAKQADYLDTRESPSTIHSAEGLGAAISRFFRMTPELSRYVTQIADAHVNAVADAEGISPEAAYQKTFAGLTAQGLAPDFRTTEMEINDRSDLPVQPGRVRSFSIDQPKDGELTDSQQTARAAAMKAAGDQRYFTSDAQSITGDTRSNPMKAWAYQHASEILNKIGSLAQDGKVTRWEGTIKDGKTVTHEVAAYLTRTPDGPRLLGLEVEPRIDGAKGIRFDVDSTNGAKAMTQFLTDGRAVVTALNQPDGVSFLHEMAHIARRSIGRSPILDESEARAVAEWAGAKAGTGPDGVTWTWPEAAEERFADGFVKYVQEGRSPAKAIQKVFGKLKGYLQKILGNTTLPDLTDDVRNAYAKLTGAHLLQAKETEALNWKNEIKAQIKAAEEAASAEEAKAKAEDDLRASEYEKLLLTEDDDPRLDAFDDRYDPHFVAQLKAELGYGDEDERQIQDIIQDARNSYRRYDAQMMEQIRESGDDEMKEVKSTLKRIMDGSVARGVENGDLVRIMKQADGVYRMIPQPVYTYDLEDFTPWSKRIYQMAKDMADHDYPIIKYSPDLKFDHSGAVGDMGRVKMMRDSELLTKDNGDTLEYIPATMTRHLAIQAWQAFGWELPKEYQKNLTYNPSKPDGNVYRGQKWTLFQKAVDKPTPEQIIDMAAFANEKLKTNSPETVQEMLAKRYKINGFVSRQVIDRAAWWANAPEIAQAAMRGAGFKEIDDAMASKLPDMSAAARKKMIGWALAEAKLPSPEELINQQRAALPQHAQRIYESGRPREEWAQYARENLHLPDQLADRAVSAATELKALNELKAPNPPLLTKQMFDQLAKDYPEMSSTAKARTVATARNDLGLPSMAELRAQNVPEHWGANRELLADIATQKLVETKDQAGVMQMLRDFYGLTKPQRMDVMALAEERIAGRRIAEVYDQTGGNYRAITDMMDREYPNVPLSRQKEVIARALDDFGRPQVRSQERVRDPETGQSYLKTGEMITAGDRVTVPQQILDAIIAFKGKFFKLWPMINEARYVERITNRDPYSYDWIVRHREEAVARFKQALQTYRQTLLNEFGTEADRKPWMVTGEKLLKDQTVQRAVFDLAEGRTLDENGEFQPYGEEDIRRELGDRADKAIALKNYIREQYDVLLDAQNEVRREFGIKEILKRKDYMTHLQQNATLWDKLYGRTAIGLHSDIFAKPDAGPSMDAIRRKSPGNPYARERIGERSERNAVQAFETYLHPALADIHLTEAAVRRMALTRALESQEAAHNLGQAARYFEAIRRQLTGDPHQLDEALENSIMDKDLAKNILKGYDAIAARMTANKLTGNIRIPLLHMTRLPGIAANVGLTGLARAAFEHALTAVSGAPDVTGASPYLQTRFADTHAITQHWIDDARMLANKPSEFIEKHTLQIGWQAYHDQAINAGKSLEEATAYADKALARHVPDRTPGGQMPLLASRVGRTVLQFQTEITNFSRYLQHDFSYNMLEDRPYTPQENMVRMAKLWTSMYVANLALRAAMGDSPTPDPVNAGIEALRILGDTNAAPGDRAVRSAGRMAGEALKFVPGSNEIAAAAIPDQHLRKYYLGNIEQSAFTGTPAALDTLQANAGSLQKIGGEFAEGGVPELLQGGDVGGFTSKAFSDILLPFGGTQIKKTIEGIAANKEGKVTGKDGKTLYDVEGADRLRALMFGPSGTQAAKTFDDIMFDRDINAERRTLARAGRKSEDE